MLSQTEPELQRQAVRHEPSDRNSCTRAITIAPSPTAPATRYFEAKDLEAAAAYLAGQDVSVRWQEAMAEFLEERVPDGGPPSLEETFRLD